MEKILQKLKENRKIVDIVLIFIIALILLVPNFNKNTNIFFDDGCHHLTRAFGSYEALLENKSTNIISRYANGYGYSWDLFYGPLSSYLQIILGIIFTSFNIGFKVLMLLIMFFAGYFMYKLVNSMTNNRNTSLLASIIYISAPYFFTDIYIRHALGECMAFIFVPLVFLGLYNLFNKGKQHYYLIFGAAGLILSHNLSTVITAMFAVAYCLLYFRKIFTKEIIKRLLIDGIFIITITSFFWVPFLQTKAYTNYRVFEKNAMAGEKRVTKNELDMRQLVVTYDDEIYVFQIGVPIAIMTVFSLLAVKKLKNNKNEYLFFVFAGIISVWMTTKYFPWKVLPDKLYIIQFPWRMLLFASFFLSIVCSINMEKLIKRFNIKDVLIICTICIIYLFTQYKHIPVAENVKDVKNFKIIEISAQSNYWLPGMGELEYLPVKAYRNTEYIATRQKGIVSLKGECEVDGNMINTTEAGALLELPYIYYPGYRVTLDGVELEIFETEHGFCGVNIDKKIQGTINVEYTGTLLMNVTKVVSLAGVIILIIYMCKKHVWINGHE